MKNTKPMTLAQAGALGGRSTSPKKVEAVRRNLVKANRAKKCVVPDCPYPHDKNGKVLAQSARISRKDKKI